MVPSRPETGYGYIVPGPELDGVARRVARFVEKPNAARALDLIAAGALWNSGLFAWTAVRLRAEVERHTPELSVALAALRAGDVPRFFSMVTPVSIDVGVLERSNAVAVVAGAFHWDDVGPGGTRPRAPDAGTMARAAYARREDCIAWSDDSRGALRRPGHRRGARERAHPRDEPGGRGAAQGSARHSSPRGARCLTGRCISSSR
jgi:hypothetical protein